MKGRSSWLAFIDESGDFSRASNPVCVAGVLLREDDSPAFGRELRMALGRALPHIVYPPHATFFNHLSFHLSRWRALPAVKRDAMDTAFARRLARAEQLIAAAPDAPRELVGPAGWLDFSTLSQLDRWIERWTRDAFLALSAVRDLGYQRLWQVLSDSAQRRGAVALVSAEAQPDSAAGAAPLPRYLRLLSGLAERVVMLLRAVDPRARLVVRVAARARQPSDGERPLTVDDVRAAFDAISRAPPPSQEAGPIEIVPMEPEPYREQVHPGLVLADYVANRLHRMMLTDALDFAALRLRVMGDLGLPVELSAGAAGRLPTVVMDGAPRQAILATLAGNAPVLTGTGWGAEQARQWITALQAARGGGGGR